MKKYFVNPNAENVLNGVAATILVIGWIFAIAGVVVGIAAAVEQGAWLYALAGVLGGGIILLMFYIIWAELKVIIPSRKSAKTKISTRGLPTGAGAHFYN